MRLPPSIFSVFIVICALVTATAIDALASPARPAHKFYTSFAQIEYNSERKTVEVSLRVFADDLENILTKRHGKSVRLGKTDGAAKLVFNYLKGTFQLKNGDGAAKEFQWVGMEAKGDLAWLYFETKMPEGVTGASLRNRFLLDFSDEQVNIVHLKADGRKADLVFKASDSDFKMFF